MLHNLNNTYIGYPIKIESPEQLVPLFLATYKPYTGIEDYTADEIYDEVYVDQDCCESLSRSELKEQMVKRLNFPYPKQYALELSSLNACDLGEESSISNCQSFVGLTGVYQSYSSLVHCGLYCKHSIVYNLKPNLANYPANKVETHSRDFMDSIKPLILVLVPAKYIPSIRARLALGLEIKIPLDCFKLLYNKTESEWDDIYTRSMIDQCNSFVHAQQPIIEFCTTEKMRSYLIGPKPVMTLKEKIDRASIILENRLRPSGIDIFEPINR